MEFGSHAQCTCRVDAAQLHPTSGGVEAAVSSITLRSSSILSRRLEVLAYLRLPSVRLTCLLGLRRGEMGDFGALLALILVARRITVFSIVTSANIDIMP